VSEAAVASAELEIAHRGQRVAVVLLGGGLRSYEVAGRELLDGFPSGGEPTRGRGQVLAPWPNRIKDGSYEFDGRQLQLELTEPEHGNAIHGLVRGETWSVAAAAPDRVRLNYPLEPQPGYPFSLALGIDYGLSDNGLTVTTTARNVGTEPCPYGCGQHPYLSLGRKIDTLQLQVPAQVVVSADERGVPTGTEPVEGSEYDFRAGRTIGGTVLDNAFTGLERDADGRACVRLDDPSSGAGLTVWVDETLPYLMVFSGDPYPDLARRSLAVEPMTCPPNAFRTGESVIRLEPGQETSSTWGIEPRLAAGGGSGG
jgi:galactose mutarotase-like enzyme